MVLVDGTVQGKGYIIPIVIIGGSKGGRQGRAPPPPGVQILSFSCSFRQKIEK